MTDLPEYTPAQLALRNGQEMEDTWVAFKGKIYKLNESRYWRRGKHYEHWAGQDLTEELKYAPHTNKVFERLTMIGKLGSKK